MSQQNFIELVSADFAAGQARLFMVSGQYFELIDCPSPVDVVLSDRNGAQRGVMRGAEASFNLKATDFAEVQIVSPTAQQVRFAYGTGEGGTRRAAGSVNIANNNGTFLQNTFPVTTVSGVYLSANTQRRYLFVQNKSTTGTVWLTVTGAAATTVNGVRLGPGDSFEVSGYVPTGALCMVGDIASNPDVMWLEG